MFKMFCGECDKANGVLYGNYPHQVKCPYTNEFHWRGEECNVEFAPVIHGRLKNGTCSVCGKDLFNWSEMQSFRGAYCPRWH